MRKRLSPDIRRQQIRDALIAGPLHALDIAKLLDCSGALVLHYARKMPEVERNMVKRGGRHYLVLSLTPEAIAAERAR